MKSIPLLVTGAHPCGYLPGESAAFAWVEPSLPMTPSLYGILLANGFRRSGDDVYRPSCPACAACVPVRLSVERFQPNRGQQRCWKKNVDTVAVLKPAVFESAHYAMYQRYQQARHTEGDMANFSASDYLRFLTSRWCRTWFVEFLVDRQLAALAVVDEVDNALSAVYTFFDPRFAKLSLGTFAVLWQLYQARIWRLDYVYLGFWIKDCRKMAYKSDFQPLQGFIENQWLDLPF